MVTFPVTLSDLWARFQGHGIIEGIYLKKGVLETQFLYNTNRKPYPIYRMVTLSMTLSDL